MFGFVVEQVVVALVEDIYLVFDCLDALTGEVLLE